MSERGESIPRLLAAIPAAALRFLIGKMPAWLVGTVLTVCGLLLIVSPVALWVSWTQEIFQLVLGVALGALLVALVLVMFGREDQL